MPLLTKDNTVVIACSMVKAEVNRVMADHHLEYPVCWIEKGLHEFPEKLKKELKSVLLAHEDKAYAILVYGMCGYAVIDLCMPNSTMAVPCFDDCVRFLMSHAKGEKIPTRPDYMYLTDEWTNSEKFIFSEFSKYVETYGKEKADMIIEMMIGNYEGVALIDDGTYDVDACFSCMEKQVAEYDLTCTKVKGTLRILEKLLTGDWDEEIVVKAPGEKITMEDFDSRPRCL